MRIPKSLVPLPACHVSAPELSPIDPDALLPEPLPPAQALGTPPPLLEELEEG